MRGSGRFGKLHHATHFGPRCFNPLHCGAVVASPGAGIPTWPWLLVSIPFIAGQWSLPKPGRRRTPSERSFNPLHCGAVVASIAWEARVTPMKKFQSPSLRGSGRFMLAPAPVSSPSTQFQSPSLRGSGRFARLAVRRGRQSAGFNPLHCGAVVASGGGLSSVMRKSSSFNPLHCGAVVASGCFRSPIRPDATDVSIPFIAGQWSLLERGERGRGVRREGGEA